jgi:3-deoxy-D-manno-octulosonic-acid transferase
MLDAVRLFLMQSRADAERIIRMGASPERVRVLGSLKWDASLSACPAAEEVQATARQLRLNGRQTVIVAGSTHRGEERALLDAFQRLRDTEPELRLIIAPRHLERVAEIESCVQREGLRGMRCATGEPMPDWQVGIVDTIGQLPRYYGLADVVVIGGSLIPHGGQNPLEATGMGKPVVFGPFMHNFSEIAEQLISHGAAKQLARPQDLTSTLRTVLADREELAVMGRKGQALMERAQGVTAKTLDALAPLLADLKPGGS